MTAVCKSASRRTFGMSFVFLFFSLVILTKPALAIPAQLSAGDSYTMAIKRDGTLWGWGYNEDRRLGDGTMPYESLPVQIGAATNWSSVSAGVLHTMAIKSDGTLWGGE
jgi:alpha-tubulin suppressor-like RCC1 family protein